MTRKNIFRVLFDSTVANVNNCTDIVQRNIFTVITITDDRQGANGKLCAGHESRVTMTGECIKTYDASCIHYSNRMVHAVNDVGIS